MAEGFELVRTVRQHLRRSATLLDEGKFDEALAEVDSALVLDPQSLPAQALRDRISTSKAGAATPAPLTGSAPLPGAFVPHGVNAASWRGFEQRITERRFKALLDTINVSIVAGDGAAAQAALEEARELRPDAPILGDFAARIAAVPVAASSPSGKASSRIWMRAMGAAALLLIGVSLLLGIEWMRPGEQATGAPAAPVAAPSVPAVTPTQDVNPAPSPDLGPVPVALNEEESVPAIETPPEPLLRPTATTGSTTGSTSPPPPPAAVTTPSLPVASARPTSTEDAPDPAPIAAEPPSVARGEVTDEFVASRRPTAALTSDAGPAVAPTSMPGTDTPVTADARGDDATGAGSVAPAAVSIPAGVDQHNRVEDVLRRYARAYSQLDASGARAVWPTVDERALARAFQNLSSQRVSLDNCDIDIRGVVANASCRGQASFAPKVGNREQRTEERNWRFELRRDGDVWQIVDVDARRQSTLDYR